ncbi:LIC_13387 family protein [Chryseobacterium echinoideorum]|uniref:LIC_13387 family protein n=1 Tax=Chryseobacterium echinoideorum TaxID=1549648 RepID=UPI00118519E2|nr:hypothetical protein [Chryseobacterium echinoideorum]
MKTSLKHKLFRIFWSIGAVLLLISGVLHFYSIFYNQDLYPSDASLVEVLKTTSIQMDESGTMWNLWIGFHAMFGLCLIFIGLSIIYFAIKHHELFSRQRFLLVITILMIAAFVVIGHFYLISDFVFGMAIALILFTAGFLLTFKKT